MKKLTLLLGLLLLASAPLVAGWCIASPQTCDDNASVQIPAGGSCDIYNGIFHARAVGYDQHGNIVGADVVYCPPRGY